MDKDYLDARFDGLEKLVTVQYKNLNEYVGAVSENVRELRVDLNEHKDSQGAHGLEVGRRTSKDFVAWGGLVIAAGAFALTLWKHG